MMTTLAPDVHVLPIRRALPPGEHGPRPVRALILRVADAQIVLTRDEVARLAADLIAMIEAPADA